MEWPAHPPLVGGGGVSILVYEILAHCSNEHPCIQLDFSKYY